MVLKQFFKVSVGGVFFPAQSRPILFLTQIALILQHSI